MNYADLFRVTLPETVLEIAALLVLVVDLGISAQGRTASSCGRGGAAGCGRCAVAAWAFSATGGPPCTPETNCCWPAGSYTAVAQIGILALTALTLLLLVDSVFTRNPGELWRWC